MSTRTAGVTTQGNRRQTVISLRLAWWNLITSLGCVSLVVFVEQIRPGWSLLVPLVVLAPYVGWVLHKADDAEMADAAADHVYFLGYLCMIAALCALGLKVWRNPEALGDSQTVALSLAMALLSTVGGLVAMTTLKAHSRALQHQDTAADFGVGMTHLINALSAAELTDTVRRLVSDLKEAPQSLDQLRNTAGLVQRAIGGLEKPLRGVAKKSKSYISGLSHGLHHTNIEIGKAIVNIQRLNRLVMEGTARIKALGTAVVQLEQVVEAFVNLQKMKIDSEGGKRDQDT